ncbi:MAG: glycosyltransferase [Candidatus Hydrogenedentes bacterium]|nr:glycosyltransferase [Candidatus Hydrogenedentota bacterium]
MSENPVVSVVTIGSNIIPYLSTWFLHLEQQDYPLGKVEWIIISTKDTPEEIKRVYNLIEGSPLKVKYYFFPNKTTRECWDIALREAVGDLILTSICDVVPSPNWISAHVKTAEEYGGNACIGGIVLPHPKIHPKSITRWFLPEDAPPTLAKSANGNILFSFSIANFSFPRELALSAGGFNKNFVFEEFAEVELAKRLTLRGVKLVVTEDATVWAWKGCSYLDSCKYHYRRGYSMRTYLNLYPEDYSIQWKYKVRWSLPKSVLYFITIPFSHRLCTKLPEDSKNLHRMYVRLFRYWRAKGFLDATLKRPPQDDKII